MVRSRVYSGRDYKIESMLDNAEMLGRIKWWSIEGKKDDTKIVYCVESGAYSAASFMEVHGMLFGQGPTI